MAYAEGRITAGLPSLVPEKRRRADVTARTRHIDRANLQQEYSQGSSTTAPDGDRPVTSLEAQLGRPLSSQEVISKLRKIGPSLHFEVSLSDPTKVGIYEIRSRERRFICGMERGFMPEFSVRHASAATVPSPSLDGTEKTYQSFERETRGWRTVLARLIRAKLVRLSDAERAFGLTRDSRNWKELTT